MDWQPQKEEVKDKGFPLGPEVMEQAACGEILQHWAIVWATDLAIKP